MRLYLVRHARTNHNVEQLCQGWTDTELDELGLQQAGHVAEYFVGRELAKIYSSDHRRAIQTALPTSLLKAIEIQKTELLRERFLGELENVPTSALRLAFEDEIHRTGESRFRVKPKGVESAYEVMGRVEQFAKELTTDAGDIAVFTHGMTKEVLLCYLIGAPVESSRNFSFDNASITVLRWDYDVWVLESYNGTEHLG